MGLVSVKRADSGLGSRSGDRCDQTINSDLDQPRSAPIPGTAGTARGAGLISILGTAPAHRSADMQPSGVSAPLRISSSWPIPPERSGARPEAVHFGMMSPWSGAELIMHNVPYPAFTVIWFQNHGYSTRHR